MSSFVSGFVDFGNLLKHMLKLQKGYKVDMKYVCVFIIENTVVIFIINVESKK